MYAMPTCVHDKITTMYPGRPFGHCERQTLCLNRQTSVLNVHMRDHLILIPDVFCLQNVILALLA